MLLFFYSFPLNLTRPCSIPYPGAAIWRTLPTPPQGRDMTGIGVLPGIQSEPLEHGAASLLPLVDSFPCHRYFFKDASRPLPGSAADTRRRNTFVSRIVFVKKNAQESALMVHGELVLQARPLLQSHSL